MARRLDQRDLQFLELLHDGANCSVHRARVSGVNRSIAVKIFNDEIAGESQSLHELRLSKILAHPNIVAIIDRLEIHGRWCVLMPEYKGGSLAEVMQRSGDIATWEQVRFLLGSVGTAIAHIHDMGWVHADIHPGNIAIDTKGNLFLIDFGNAVPMGHAASAGTVGFAPPEQWDRFPLDGRADVFGLAAVAATMLTQQVYHHAPDRFRIVWPTGIPTVARQRMLAALCPDVTHRLSDVRMLADLAACDSS